tara:strand:- start:50473 stop:50967 length:495 start_codon:yes stop_codon:yes gene_type:complete
MRHTLAAIVAVLSLATAASAQEISDAERVARAYMQAYSDIDWDGMLALTDEDILFTDETGMGEGVPADGYRDEGIAARRASLEEFSETYHPITLGLQWDTVFESNGRVVFMGEVNALYPTQTEGRLFRWRSPQVSVITVRDGKVVRHEDFANYATPDQSILITQ